MIVKPLPVGDTVVTHLLSNRQHLLSHVLSPHSAHTTVRP